MKKLALLLALLFPFVAVAQNTPPGSNGNIVYNNNGRFGPYVIGGGLAITTSGGNTYLNATSSGSANPAGLPGALQYNANGIFGGYNLGTGLSAMVGGSLSVTTTPAGLTGDIQYNAGSSLFGNVTLTPNSLLGEVTTGTPVPLVINQGLSVVTTGGLSYLNVTATGTLPATTTNLGSVIVGSGLAVTATGVLSATVTSSTPTGSAGGDLGGTYPNPTVVSVGDVTTGVLKPAQLPLGSSTTPGAIQCGSGVSCSGGVLSATGTGGGGGLPATTTALGSIIVGGNLAVTSTGVLSANINNGLANGETGIYASGSGWAGLTTGTIGGVGGTVQQFFEAANELYLITQGMDVDPRYYGAACNFQYADGRYPNLGLLSTTSGSPVVSIQYYTPTNCIAAPGNSCDVGKVFSPNGVDQGNLGPTTYILSVTTTSMTLGENMNATTTGGYAVFGGAPPYPSVTPSQAVDDTGYIEEAASVSAIYHGGKVDLPANCGVHNLALANETELVGNNGGNYYGYNQPKSVTTLYAVSNGFGDDSQTGINIANATEVRLRDFTLQCATFPCVYGPGLCTDAIQYQGLGMAGIGSTTGAVGAANADAILLDHVSVAYCPVNFGLPWFEGTPTSFTASATTGGVMTVSAITYGGILALGQTITGAGLANSTTISGVTEPYTGGIGTYQISPSPSGSVSSEAMTVVVSSGHIFGQSHFSEFVNGSIGMRDAFSDWASFGDVFTGNFVRHIDLEQFGASYPAVSSRFVGDRIEEGGVGLYCNGCLSNMFIGDHFQFMGGYGAELLGATYMMFTGDKFEGNTGAHVEISNSDQISFSNTSWYGNTSYALDATISGAVQSNYVSNIGGNTENCCLTAFANWGTVGAPAHFILDTADQNYLRTGDTSLTITSSGFVGLGSTSPAVKLDVNGGMALEMGTTGSVLCLTTTHSLGHCASGASCTSGCTCSCVQN